MADLVSMRRTGVIAALEVVSRHLRALLMYRSATPLTVFIQLGSSLTTPYPMPSYSAAAGWVALNGGQDGR